jgi:hypothetical protein
LWRLNPSFFGCERVSKGSGGGKEERVLRVAVLGTRCTAWLLSMVEEVLRNPGIEGFVKSFRERSKVTITWRGKNRSGLFLEVAVYTVGGRKRLILFPEGRDGRGWSHVSGELSKALAFLGAMDGSSSSGGPLAGNKLGKEAGLSLFAEVVHSAATVSVMGCRPLGQTSGSRGVAKVEDTRPVAEWCELEKFHLLGMEMEVIRQVMDCFALEKQTFGPLGKNLRVDDRFSSRDFRGSSACVFRDA